MGLGDLLGRGHASTPQSGVEAPRLLKRSLPRLGWVTVVVVVSECDFKENVHPKLRVLIVQRATPATKAN